MNRRDSIKSIIAISTLPLVAIKYLGRSTKPMHFIGLGNAGCIAAYKIQQKGLAARFTFIDKGNKFVIKKKAEFIQLDLSVGVKTTIPFEIPSRIYELLSTDHKFVLLAGLGGGVGSYLAEKLTKWMNHHNKSFLNIYSTPFNFEGLRNERAQRVKEQLAHNSNCHFFSLNSIRTKHGNLKINDAFDKAGDKFYEIYLKHQMNF